MLGHCENWRAAGSLVEASQTAADAGCLLLAACVRVRQHPRIACRVLARTSYATQWALDCKPFACAPCTAAAGGGGGGQHQTGVFLQQNRVTATVEFYPDLTVNFNQFFSKPFVVADSLRLADGRGPQSPRLSAAAVPVAPLLLVLLACAACLCCLLVLLACAACLCCLRVLLACAACLLACAAAAAAEGVAWWAVGNACCVGERQQRQYCCVVRCGGVCLRATAMAHKHCACYLRVSS